MTHVAIDVRMARHSGIGTYIRNLVPRVVAARPEWRFTLLADPAVEAVWEKLPNVQVIPAAAPIYGVTEQVALWRATPHDTDLFWAPHYNIPLLVPAPLLVTVHDVYHLARASEVEGAHRRLYARAMFGAVRRRAAGIICVSRFTRDEFTRHAGTPRGPLRIIHGAVDESWAERPAGPRVHERPYVVAVGNVKTNKNLGALIQAMQLIAAEVPHDLVLVGRNTGMGTTDTGVAQAAAALGERVRFLGAVDDGTLRRAVADAAALAFPSRYEGFGLPPLEAMMAGVPCIVSNAASLPEVCGNGALYCDPEDPATLARGLRTILTDTTVAADLRTRGTEHVRTFHWTTAARETADVMQEIVGVRTRR